MPEPRGLAWGPPERAWALERAWELAQAAVPEQVWAPERASPGPALQQASEPVEEQLGSAFFTLS